MIRLPKEEIGRRGEDVFRRRVAPTLRDTKPGRYVAIDVVTEDFVIDADKRRAVTTLKNRCPEAQTWLRKTDNPAASRIGHWRST